MRMKKWIQFSTPKTVVPNGGQGYFPADISRLYQFPSGLDGAGQTIGIVEFSNGYRLADAVQFWTSHGIAPPKVTFVSVDGVRNDGGSQPQDEEASLDLQWAGALAPKAHLVVYEAHGGTTYASFADALTRTLTYILNDQIYNPSVLSISYGDGEATFDEKSVRAWAGLIEQLDAKGITVCIASGDQGAYGLHNLHGIPKAHADAPATSPTAVTVGGTSLQPDGSETAWTYRGTENGGATGGGYSSLFLRPRFQWMVTSSQYRGIPDVALNADPATGYQIVFQGTPTVVGGTSVSCPVFAAMVALSNQNRASSGKPPLTGLTSILYRNHDNLGFKDIVQGNNSFDGVGGYSARPGWDACTGWGSVNASQFISFLASV